MHITRDKDLLYNTSNVPKSQVITTSGRALVVAAQGNINLPSNKPIYNILYAVGIYKNLISIGKLADEGYYTLFGSKDCWVFGNKNEVIFTGSKTNNLYCLNSSIHGFPRTFFTYTEPLANIASTSTSASNLWHQHMGT